MTMLGSILFFLSVVAAIAIPFLYIDAMKKVKNDDDSVILNKIALGICSGLIVWMILMMLRTLL